MPDAETLVSGFRSRFDRSAARGMPAHITVLYPFLHPDSLTVGILRDLHSLFLGHRRFRFTLGGVCGFPDVVYLAPEPLAPFDGLTRAVAARFPETPPYGGVIADPIPHLTLAQRPPAPSLEEVSERFVREVGVRLPLECAADEVALAVKRAGRWSIGPGFALG